MQFKYAAVPLLQLPMFLVPRFSFSDSGSSISGVLVFTPIYPRPRPGLRPSVLVLVPAPAVRAGLFRFSCACYTMQSKYAAVPLLQLSRSSILGVLVFSFGSRFSALGCRPGLRFSSFSLRSSSLGHRSSSEDPRAKFTPRPRSPFFGP